MRDIRPFILVLLFAVVASALAYLYGYDQGEEDGREVERDEIQREFDRLMEDSGVSYSEPEPRSN